MKIKKTIEIMGNDEEARRGWQFPSQPLLGGSCHCLYRLPRDTSRWGHYSEPFCKIPRGGKCDTFSAQRGALVKPERFIIPNPGKPSNRGEGAGLRPYRGRNPTAKSVGIRIPRTGSESESDPVGVGVCRNGSNGRSGRSRSRSESPSRKPGVPLVL